MSKITSPINTKNVSIPKVWIWLSVLIAFLVTITSLLGIFFKKTYSRETEAWAVQAIGQDCANLIVVIILLISTYHVAKKSLKAYLLWLGTFIYIIYAFSIYAFFIHFNFLFLAYVLIFGLSFYTPVGGLIGTDISNYSKIFLSNTKAKSVSVLLMAIGILFVLLWLSEIIPNILSDKIPDSLIKTGLWVNPVHVLDLAFLLPAMIITSVLLWRKKMLGFLLAVPLLVFSVTMGIGIIILFVISSKKGMPSSLPAGIIIGVIVFISTYFSYLFLKELKDT
jgi:hypothetical protein